MGGMTIFVGSFLSFFIEPMVGRTLLPWFGGSASVWVTCLAGFQLLMVAGYFYGGKAKVRVHLPLLLISSVWCLAVVAWRKPMLAWISGLTEVPALNVLIGVLALCGPAFVLLSANATLVQLLAGGNYRLYAVSNFGSFCGLLAYPLAVEPFVAIPAQWACLGAGIVAYGVLLAFLARKGSEASGIGCSEEDRTDAFPRDHAAWLWLALPAVSCALMTSVTTHLTTDFEPLPLLWAVILALFLLSYVIGFSRFGSGGASFWVGGAVVALGVAAWAMRPQPDNIVRFYWNAGAAFGLLLVVGTALHAWLYRLRPARAGLPRFYLFIALGGAAGGLATGLGAPLAFDRVLEYPIVLILAALLFAGLLLRWGMPRTVWLNRVGVLILLSVSISVFQSLRYPGEASQQVLFRIRGFYGVNDVTTTRAEYGLAGRKGDYHSFHNGCTEHGAQLWAEGEQGKPRAYYSLNGGTVPFLEHPKRKAGKPLRAAFVGMGIGSLAACGEKGDYFRFYEISPEVVSIATNREYFTFLSDSRATCDIVLGDARVEMTKDAARGIETFDIVFVDAYSGDSIPTHLITAEAFRLYRSLLAEGGILACHLSNWHMNLWPVMKAAAKELDLEIYGWVAGPVYSELVAATYWACMTEKPFKPRLPNCCHIVDFDGVEDSRLITDDCGSLVFNIRFNYFPPYLGE